MQSAYYLHINQAVDHERAAAQPNAALSQEEDSVIIIHQCYDVVIDYNIFLLPWGTPTANPASGLDFCTPPPSHSLRILPCSPLTQFSLLHPTSIFAVLVHF